MALRHICRFSQATPFAVGSPARVQFSPPPSERSSRCVRVVYFLAAILTVPPAAFGQASAAAKPTETKDEPEPVVLSAFEVVMTQDKGYHHGSSINALKSDDRIMDIPQSLQVITRDMIDDIGTINVSDILNYAGVSNFYQGDSAVVRGQVLRPSKRGHVRLLIGGLDDQRKVPVVRSEERVLVRHGIL